MSENNNFGKTVSLKFGEIIKRERTRLGLTQTEFAHAMGFKSYQILVRYESGDMVSIPADSYARFAQIVGISLKDLILEIFCDEQSKETNTKQSNSQTLAKILEGISKTEVDCLYKACMGGVGDSFKNIRNIVRVATLYARLPLLGKMQSHEFVLKELAYSGKVSSEEKNALINEMMMIHRRMSIESQKYHNALSPAERLGIKQLVDYS